MKRIRILAQEQYRLIQECRQSGLSDHQWCMEHEIHPGTFYNWVRRLRQKPEFVILERNQLQKESISQQEIVKVELAASHLSDSCRNEDPVPFCESLTSMELSFHGVSLRIPNGTDPQLLGQLLSALREFAC